MGFISNAQTRRHPIGHVEGSTPPGSEGRGQFFVSPSPWDFQDGWRGWLAYAIVSSGSECPQGGERKRERRVARENTTTGRLQPAGPITPRPLLPFPSVFLGPTGRRLHHRSCVQNPGGRHSRSLSRGPIDWMIKLPLSSPGCGLDRAVGQDLLLRLVLVGEPSRPREERRGRTRRRRIDDAGPGQ